MKKGINVEALTDAELVAEHKKRKRYFITWIAIWLVLSAATAYNSVVDGTVSFYSLFPVICWIPLIIVSRKAYTMTQTEIQKRNISL